MNNLIEIEIERIPYEETYCLNLQISFSNGISGGFI